MEELGGSVSSHGAALKEFAGLQGSLGPMVLVRRSLAPPRNWPLCWSPKAWDSGALP